MIYDHTNEWYKLRWKYSGVNQYNGAYYYSKEIVRSIIPNIDTDRNWITVNIPQNNHAPQFAKCGASHSIVFVHNNLHPENYEWLKRYHDLILVCGVKETMEKVEHLGTPIYLPLSIDVEEVRKHRKRKTRGTAFAGRVAKSTKCKFPGNVDFLMGIPRDDLLDSMARYRRIYAVGRTAIEAKVLGCEILPYDERFPDPDRWIVMDNSEAVGILQRQLDIIDGR